MRTLLKTGLFITLFWMGTAVLPSHLLAWGADGHKTVGAMADQLIQNTSAEQEVRQLLKDGETLMSVSVWADCAKGYTYCHASPTSEMKEFTKQNGHHHDYHFTDIPFENTAYKEDTVGAGDNDVVHIIRQCIHVLSGHTDAASNPHSFTRRQALLLLTHFVGDIHQPLHVGSAYIDAHDHFGVPEKQEQLDSHEFEITKGDNYIMKNSSENLHSYWDENAVKNAMRKAQANTPEGYASALLAKYPATEVMSTAIDNWPVAWADESLKSAKAAHAGMQIGHRGMGQDRDGQDHLIWPITVLPGAYTDSAEDVAEQALVNAGKRLALILKTIWP